MRRDKERQGEVGHEKQDGTGDVEGEMGQEKAGWDRMRWDSKQQDGTGEVGQEKAGWDRVRWNRGKQGGAGEVGYMK